MDFENRTFCSSDCLGKFKLEKVEICKCGKEFQRVNGILDEGKWVCGEDCVEEFEFEEEEDLFVGIDPITGDPIYREN